MFSHVVCPFTQSHRAQLLLRLFSFSPPAFCFFHNLRMVSIAEVQVFLSLLLTPMQINRCCGLLITHALTLGPVK